MRIGIGIVGVLSTIIALTIPTIYGLWSMCSDLVYVILFPQLLMVIHFKNYCNTYGSLAAYIVGLIVRLSGGEGVIGLPAYVHYPGYDYVNNVQMFPFRTMAMLMSLMTLVGVSWWMRWMFLTGKFPPGYDVFRCVVNLPDDDEQRVGLEPADVEEEEKEEEEGEQMAVLAAGLGRLYGSKDQANGRVNSALVPDDDVESDTGSSGRYGDGSYTVINSSYQPQSTVF